MSVRPCPKCEIPTARMLASSNRPATIYYYHCERCGHIWSAARDFLDPTIAPRQPIPRKRTGKKAS